MTIGSGLDEDAATPEMDPVSQELLQTLRDAAEAVRAELEYFSRAPFLDAANLSRVQGSAAEFAGQAAYLLSKVRGRSADEALVSELVTLSRFFRDAEDQIGSLLQAARQGARE